jgi:MFS family permease
MLARIPVTAAPVVLTLHVVLGLHRGFAESGLVAAATALGAAVGAPMLGRGVDRFGLRSVLVLTTAAQGAFWAVAGSLTYAVLLPSALLCGLLALPVFSVARQSLAALLPPSERQAGYALDSMGVELSFAVGPALGILVLTQAGTAVAFGSLATLLVVSGVALIVLDPPVHGEAGVAVVPRGQARPVRTAAPPRLLDWAGLRVVAVLFAAFGATFTLAGTETALAAIMRSFGDLPLLGPLIAIWCLASLLGGFVYGTRSRRVDPLVLLALMAGLTVPAAAAGSWQLLALLVIPSGLFCAPLMSSSAELLAELAPVGARGQAMGVHASALTVGNAAGAPLIGLVVDHADPRFGLVAVGLAGLALALAGLLGQRAVRPAAPVPSPERAGGVTRPQPTGTG